MLFISPPPYLKTSVLSPLLNIQQVTHLLIKQRTNGNKQNICYLVLYLPIYFNIKSHIINILFYIKKSNEDNFF